MSNAIPPAAIFILGGLLIPLFRGKLKAAWMLLLPVLGLVNVLLLTEGDHCKVAFLDMELVFLHVDRLSLLFSYIFHLITFIAVLFVLNMPRNEEYVAGFVYAGSALGVIFAGDLFSFFAFWEMLTIGSVFLIWARRTQASLDAGFRYLLVHVVGGLILLAGIVMHVHEKESLAFTFIGLDGTASWFIFIGMGINCAWPALHAWLVDAYPEATIGGVIFLSAFTTKTAVYALARGFPGTELLIYIGVAMAAFPIFYAVIENDLRKVLAYSLINQVGFMVVGIGIGTPLALNGATAHAFNDILFKALLFMSLGAVMFRTGKINATDLGGLYKSMPLTALFCCIGAASISAFPLFSGFVSKSMVMDAAGQGQMTAVWLLLLFASAGVFHHAGIKIPFFAFFGHDAGHRVKEAPLNMLIAMGIAAALCIFNGSYPAALYSLLPWPVDYEPYTAAHVVAQTQLLFFSALAFSLLLLSGIYPAEMRAVNVDADWFYRRGSRLFYRVFDTTLNSLNRAAARVFMQALPAGLHRLTRDGPGNIALLFLVPFWALAGIDPEDRAARTELFLRKMRTGTLPIGLIALSVIICLGVLCFFSGWL